MLTWTIWRAPTNASKWRMGFNLAFKGLIWVLCSTEEISNNISLPETFQILIPYFFDFYVLFRLNEVWFFSPVESGLGVSLAVHSYLAHRLRESRHLALGHLGLILGEEYLTYRLFFLNVCFGRKVPTRIKYRSVHSSV